MIISGKQFIEIQQASIDMIISKEQKSENAIKLWEYIKTKFGKCSLCGIFNSSECAMCYDFKIYILDQATSSEEAHEYLRKLERKFSTDGLYTFDDYEKE
jgi:recombinational DNA repair protein RecR